MTYEEIDELRKEIKYIGYLYKDDGNQLNYPVEFAYENGHMNGWSYCHKQIDDYLKNLLLVAKQ
jgi:hypothetical protein